MEYQPKETKEIVFAHNGLKEFFGNFYLYEAIEEFDSIFTAALAQKVWKVSSPNNLLFFIRELRELFIHAIAIDEGLYQRSYVIHDLNLRDTSIEILSPLLISLDDSAFHAWKNFPRHLSFKEFMNPYKAIRKFSRLRPKKEWIGFLQDITEFALSPDKIDEMIPSLELHLSRKHALKLIEACSLLVSRSINHTKQPSNSNENKLTI